MFTRLKSLLAAPVFADEERTRTVRLLNPVVWTALIVTGLYTIVVALGETVAGPHLAFLSLVLGLELGVLGLMRRGHVHWASILFVSIGWCLLVISAYFFGGVSDSSFDALAIIILMAGLLLGGRVGVVLAGVSVIAGLGLLYLELALRLPASLAPESATRQWLNSSFVFLFVAVMLHLATRQILEALDRARRNEQALTDSNRELHAARLIAEQHVTELQQAQAALRQAGAELERRVQARTADLAAANLALHSEITERKRAAEIAQLNDERFQLVSYATNDTVWDYDLQTGMIWWSRGLQTLFGYLPTEVEPSLGWWEDRIHPNDRAKVSASFHTMLTQGEQFWSKEYRFRRADQSYAYVFDRAYVMQDADQHPTRVVGAILDITNLKQAEAVALESEQRLRLLFDHSPDAILLIDPHSTAPPWAIVDCNEATGRMNGYSRAELIGQSINILNTSPGDAEEHAVYLDRLREAGMLQYETVHRHRDGRLLSVEVSTAVITIAGRELVLGIDRDITSRKLADEALLQSEQRYRELFTAAQEQAHEIAALYRASTQLVNPGVTLPVLTEQIARAVTHEFAFAHCSVLLFDAEQNQLSRIVNVGEFQAAGAAHLPLTGPGLIGAAARDRSLIYAPDVLADPRYLASDSRTRSELVIPLEVGDELVGVLDLQSPVVNAFDDRAQRVILAFAQQASLGIKNAQLLVHLEQAYTTLHRDQEKLLLAEKMASLGRLTAGIAHEMNTPLATVRAALVELGTLIREYQSSIGDSQVTPADHAAIAAEMLAASRLADSAAERAATFVRGIKSQTRDLAPHERQQFNAVTIVSEALTLLGHALRQGQCTASFLPAHDSLELYGAPGRLAQVVTNLVTNAIDASAPQGGLIELRLMKMTNGVDLVVSDQGSGISPEHLPKIFDPMFTTKPFGEGTGLGLTIVHDIVTGDFQGTIAVDSQPGRGATFRLHFPPIQEHRHGA